MNFRKKVLNPIFYVLNSFVAIGFILALVAPYVPPDRLSLFAFAATGFPILLLVNILFLIWWLVQFHKLAIFHILMLALGYSAIHRTYGLGSTYKAFEQDQKLRVMTYNVRNFNIWNWLDDPEITQKIEQLIRKEDPDIILFQEYHRRGRIKLEDYPYKILGELDNGGAAGLAIYSKFDFESAERIVVGKDRITTNLLKVRIKWKDRKLSIYNLHLASVGLEQSEYETLKNPDQKNSDDLKSGLIRIIKLLNQAYQRRTGQVKTLNQHFGEDDDLVIFGGDFNDVPQSYTYHTISNKLTDSFLSAKGGGFGNTYARGPLPLRIDYLFHSNNLRSKNYQVIEKKLSDHFPLVCDFVLDN